MKTWIAPVGAAPKKIAILVIYTFGRPQKEWTTQFPLAWVDHVGTSLEHQSVSLRI